MKNLLAIGLFVFPFIAFSQTKRDAKARFHSFVSSGVVTGESSASALFQYSGGVLWRRYFAGIGIGYERYKFNSIPLFADWRVNFGNNDIGFVYANLGYNFPGRYEKTEEWNKIKDHLDGGVYLDAGVGSRIPIGKRLRIWFSGGYSNKQVTVDKQYSSCGSPPCSLPPYDYKYLYKLGRIIVKAGLEL